MEQQWSSSLSIPPWRQDGSYCTEVNFLYDWQVYEYIIILDEQFNLPLYLHYITLFFLHWRALMFLASRGPAMERWCFWLAKKIPSSGQEGLGLKLLFNSSSSDQGIQYSAWCMLPPEIMIVQQHDNKNTVFFRISTLPWLSAPFVCDIWNKRPPPPPISFNRSPRG